MDKNKNIRPGKLFIISAPSGAGKTTLAAAVRKQLNDTIPLLKVVTYTTRQPRQGEKDGVDYHFVTEEAFLKLKRDNNFLETNCYNHTWYGSPRSVLDACAQGESFLMVLDPNGARSVLGQAPEAILMWIVPPSIQALRERLTARGTESEKEVDSRLAIAQQELENEINHPLFHFRVVNDDAVQEIIKIITEKL